LLPFLRVKKNQAKLLLDLVKYKRRGRKGVFVNKHKDRWGKIITFKNACYSQKQIEYMENLYTAVRSFNTTNWKLKPLPI